MAAPSMFQIAGQHGGLYEGFFKQADAKGNGIIEALEAAEYLKKFGLNENVLSEIWDLADSGCKGCLDKQSFFVALKLIALVQNGFEPTILNLHNKVPPPAMGPIAGPNSPGLVAPVSFSAPPPPPPVEWAVTLEEKAKYDRIFDGLVPVNGLLSGDKVRPVLMNSKLPVDVLGRVWDHSDIDKDGYLDSEEFAVAMHLVYKALEKEPVPMLLPQNLIPISKRKRGPMAPSLPTAAPGMPQPAPPEFSPVASLTAGSAPGVAPTAPWVVTPSEKLQFDEMFKAADLDMDGFVNGVEIKDIFLKSGVQQSVLAHIWNLCDTSCLGKLNTEQFALAMWMVQQMVQGIEPPQALSPEMVPPSLRPPVTLEAGSASSMDPNSSGMMELDMITTEIEKLKATKMQLEQEKAQKDADMKIRNGDVATQQKELDAINATVKQLEAQKGEAQKRLDDLDDKKSKLENDVTGLKEKYDEETSQIADLHNKLENQESLKQNQEIEMETMKEELNGLRSEEGELEHQMDAGNQQLQQLLKSLVDTRAQIEQCEAEIEKWEKEMPTLEDDIKNYEGLLNDDSSAVDPDAKPAQNMGGFGVPASSNDPFQNEDPFKNADDPFKGKNGQNRGQGDPFASDPFADADPFASATPPAGKAAATKQSSVDELQGVFGAKAEKKDDPFQQDPFGSAFGSKKPTSATNDPFSAFGGNSSSASSAFVNPSDPFGTDPWPSDSGGGLKKAAPPRPRSKSPALLGLRPGAGGPSLPPKQKKAPAPPRPGPPGRPPAPRATGPSPAPPSNTADPFGGSSDLFGGTSGTEDPFGGGSFASFSPSKFGEADEMAWATQSSKADFAEQERRRKQEEEDLKLAIALSQQESSEA